jgi:hypothetical protein
MSAKSAKEAQPSSSAKIDAELLKQLKTASDSEKLVEAVVRLRPDDPSQIVPAAERTEEVANQLLKRVEKQSGKAASRYNVFRNLGSFVVSANPTFIRELMSQPEVASVAANQRPGSALIPPIRKAPQRKNTAGDKSMGGGRVSTASKKSARKSAK